MLTWSNIGFRPMDNTAATSTVSLCAKPPPTISTFLNIDCSVIQTITHSKLNSIKLK